MVKHKHNQSVMTASSGYVINNFDLAPHVGHTHSAFVVSFGTWWNLLIQQGQISKDTEI